MAGKAEPVSVQLAPDLFLDSLGKFTRSKPLDSLIATPSGGVFHLPDELKSFLSGKELKEVRTNSIVKAVEDFLGIGDKAREFAKDLFSIATSLASVVGYVQAAVKILEALGIFGPDPTQAALARIEKRVNEIFNLAFGSAQDAKVVEVRKQLSAVRNARDQMIDYLKFPFPQTPQQQQDLTTAYQGLRTARHNLLSQDFHNMPFRWSQYSGNTTLAMTGWWVIKSAHAAATTPVPDLRMLSDGAFRWDYRLIMPALQEAVMTSLSFFKTIDPAFRTTGRFREELVEMASLVAAFATNMIACVQWTRDYDTVRDFFFTPLAGGYPVGAVDVCSGASSIEQNWKDGIVSVPPVNQPPGWPHTVLNVEETLARGRLERERAWFSVLANSGIPEMLQLQRRLQELSSAPTKSETLDVRTNRSGTRTFVRTEDYTAKPTLACDGKTFSADVYHVQRQWRVTSPLQPAFYAEQYVIPYRFYVEALSTGEPVEYPWAVISRAELTGTQGSVTLSSVRKYTWEVKSSPAIEFLPARKARIARLATRTPSMKLMMAPAIWLKPFDQSDVEAHFSADAADNDGRLANPTWGSVTIDYRLSRTDGRVSIALRNRPEEGNFANVFLVIEEMPRPIPGPQPVIRTAVDISAVGVEHHLGEDYFDHLEECEERLAELLEYLSHFVEVHPPGPPIPPWDPYRFPSVEEYVAMVHRLQPEIIPRQMMTRAAFRRIGTLPPGLAEQALRGLRRTSARTTRAKRSTGAPPKRRPTAAPRKRAPKRASKGRRKR